MWLGIPKPMIPYPLLWEGGVRTVGSHLGRIPNCSEVPDTPPPPGNRPPWRPPPPPVGETTPQVAIPGPTSRRWGEVLHRRLGMAAWTHLANGEGICLPLRGLDDYTTWTVRPHDCIRIAMLLYIRSQHRCVFSVHIALPWLCIASTLHCCCSTLHPNFVFRIHCTAVLLHSSPHSTVFFCAPHTHTPRGGGGATPRVLGCQLPHPPQGASGQQLVVKGVNPRSQWAP